MGDATKLGISVWPWWTPTDILNEMDAMDDWKTIAKPKSVAALLALPSQAENDLALDIFSVVWLKSTLPTGLPSSEAVVITRAIFLNKIRKHPLSFCKSINKKNQKKNNISYPIVNPNMEYSISFQNQSSESCFSHGSVDPAEGATNLKNRQKSWQFLQTQTIGF